jgi:hypothetical protein
MTGRENSVEPIAEVAVGKIQRVNDSFITAEKEWPLTLVKDQQLTSPNDCSG